MVDPTAFARVANPGIAQGMTQGLAAISMGAQAGREKRAEELNQQALSLSKAAIDSWKNKDRAGYQTKLQELAAIDPKAADDVRKTFNNLSWDNVVEAGYNMFAAASSPDIQAQNKLIGNSIDILGQGPQHWMTQGLQRISAMPDGQERQKELLGTVDMLKRLGVYPKADQAGQEKRQKTGAFLVEDDQGNAKIITGSFNPADGTLEIAGAPIPTGYKMISELGETADEQTKRRIQEMGGKEKAKEAVTASKKFADQYMKIQDGMRTIDEGISILENGIARGENLGVGPLKKYLPKWNEASARLENIANQMGLDVVSSVTFGALSQSELRMAMQTAMPTNLNDRQLLEWMRSKKASQQKLANYLQEASLFIGSEKPGGGFNTVQDWMQKNKEASQRQTEQGQGQEQQMAQQPQQQMPQQTVRADQVKDVPSVRTMAEGEALGPGQRFIFNGVLYEN